MKEKNYITVDITHSGTRAAILFKYNDPTAIVDFFKNTLLASRGVLTAESGLHIRLGLINYITDKGNTIVLGCRDLYYIDLRPVFMPVTGAFVGHWAFDKYAEKLKQAIDDLNIRIACYLSFSKHGCHIGKEAAAEKAKQLAPKQLVKEFAQVKKAKEAYEQAVMDAKRARDLEEERLADYNRLKGQLISKL